MHALYSAVRLRPWSSPSSGCAVCASLTHFAMAASLAALSWAAAGDEKAATASAADDAMSHLRPLVMAYLLTRCERRMPRAPTKTRFVRLQVLPIFLRGDIGLRGSPRVQAPLRVRRGPAIFFNRRSNRAPEGHTRWCSNVAVMWLS